MDVFLYPGVALVRRHGPRGYVNYDSYKPWLRDDFAFRCVYCLCRERWFPDGDAVFSADHLLSQTTAPEFRAEYDNLVYCCCQCNSIKGNSLVPNPCEHAYGQHVRVLADGVVEALTATGTELIGICRLNRPTLVSFRRGLFDVLDQLVRRNGPQATAVLQNYLGLPASLPNLALLRPPGGNTKPDGIKDSYFSRKSRGVLPDLYSY